MGADTTRLWGGSELRFARALMRARDPAAVARLLERKLERHWPGIRVALGFATRRDLKLRIAPARARAWADSTLLERATGALGPVAERGACAVPLLLHGPGLAVLALAVPEDGPGQIVAALAPLLETLALRLDELLMARRLRASVRRVQRAERVQRALYEIADLSGGELPRGAMLRAVHRVVAGLMYAENLFIVLYQRERRTLSFAYFVDRQDQDVPDPERELPEAAVEHSLTLAVLRQGKPLMGPSRELSARLGLPAVPSDGPECEDWLGVPMLAEGEVKGAIVVQSYDPAVRFKDSDRTLLAYVASHVLTALDRHRAQAELERKVALRTAELTEEVREREASERLQAALFRIAELTDASDSMEAFYAAVHGIVGELLYAKNFFIALLVDDRTAFDFPYASDERDPASFFVREPLGRGLSEYVLRRGKAVLATRAEIEALAAAGEVRRAGSPAVCWLGVPLVLDDIVVGVLVVQSYTEGIVYTARDQELLTFVSFHIASALERRRAQASLRLANLELTSRIEELHRAQTDLIENEKMAALGRLVAGVAHEVNTPLGVGMTAVSFLSDQLKGLRAELGPGRADEHFGPLEAACAMVQSNLKRAANLVQSFKQVAVDQSTSDIRTVHVREYLEGTLASLHPVLRKTPHRVLVDCDPALSMTSRPDALYQVIMNLVMNSVHHAYPDGRAGTLSIAAERADGRLTLCYADDGAGMDESVAARMFEPFFTTKRDQGGTGLGMHIVYNLVSHALGGRIACNTAPGRGVRFEIVFPAVHPLAPTN